MAKKAVTSSMSVGFMSVSLKTDDVMWVAEATGTTQSAEMARLMMTIPMTAFRFTNEIELQDGVEQMLKDLAIAYEREYMLKPFGRIDFYLPAPKVGIEIKVKGSPSAVTKQLHGYAQHKDVAELLLITSRMKLGQLPAVLNNKPFASIGLAASWM